MGLPMVNENDALMAEKEETIAAELVVAAVPTADNDLLLDMNKTDDWKVEGAASVEEVESVEVKRKLRKLQTHCCTKMQKVLASVAEAFTLANEILVSVDVHTSKAERATCADRGEVHKVKSETMIDVRDGSRKLRPTLLLNTRSCVSWLGQQTIDTQMKKTREAHARKLDALRDLYTARESDSLQEHNKWLEDQEQKCTESNAMYSRYHDVLSTVHPPALESTLGEGRSEELVSGLQLL